MDQKWLNFYKNFNLKKKKNLIYDNIDMTSYTIYVYSKEDWEYNYKMKDNFIFKKKINNNFSKKSNKVKFQFNFNYYENKGILNFKKIYNNLYSNKLINLINF